MRIEHVYVAALGFTSAVECFSSNSGNTAARGERASSGAAADDAAARVRRSSTTSLWLGINDAPEVVAPIAALLAASNTLTRRSELQKDIDSSVETLEIMVDRLEQVEDNELVSLGLVLKEDVETKVDQVKRNEEALADVERAITLSLGAVALSVFVSFRAFMGASGPAPPPPPPPKMFPAFPAFPFSQKPDAKAEPKSAAAAVNLDEKKSFVQGWKDLLERKPEVEEPQAKPNVVVDDEEDFATSFRQTLKQILTGKQEEPEKEKKSLAAEPPPVITPPVFVEDKPPVKTDEAGNPLKTSFMHSWREKFEKKMSGEETNAPAEAPKEPPATSVLATKDAGGAVIDVPAQTVVVKPAPSGDEKKSSDVKVAEPEGEKQDSSTKNLFGKPPFLPGDKVSPPPQPKLDTTATTTEDVDESAKIKDSFMKSWRQKIGRKNEDAVDDFSDSTYDSLMTKLQTSSDLLKTDDSVSSDIAVKPPPTASVTEKSSSSPPPAKVENSAPKDSDGVKEMEQSAKKGTVPDTPKSEEKLAKEDKKPSDPVLKEEVKPAVKADAEPKKESSEKKMENEKTDKPKTEELKKDEQTAQSLEKPAVKPAELPKGEGAAQQEKTSSPEPIAPKVPEASSTKPLEPKKEEKSEPTGPVSRDKAAVPEAKETKTTEGAVVASPGSPKAENQEAKSAEPPKDEKQEKKPVTEQQVAKAPDASTTAELKKEEKPATLGTVSEKSPVADAKVPEVPKVSAEALKEEKPAVSEAKPLPTEQKASNEPGGSKTSSEPVKQEKQEKPPSPDTQTTKAPETQSVKPPEPPKQDKPELTGAVKEEKPPTTEQKLSGGSATASSDPSKQEKPEKNPSLMTQEKPEVASAGAPSVDKAPVTELKTAKEPEGSTPAGTESLKQEKQEKTPAADPQVPKVTEVSPVPSSEAPKQEKPAVSVSEKTETTTPKAEAAPKESSEPVKQEQQEKTQSVELLVSAVPKVASMKPVDTSTLLAKAPTKQEEPKFPTIGGLIEPATAVATTPGYVEASAADQIVVGVGLAAASLGIFATIMAGTNSMNDDDENDNDSSSGSVPTRPQSSQQPSLGVLKGDGKRETPRGRPEFSQQRSEFSQDRSGTLRDRSGPPRSFTSPESNAYRNSLNAGRKKKERPFFFLNDKAEVNELR